MVSFFRNRQGFGLVELMVMVGISLTIMLAMALMTDTNLRQQRNIAALNDWDQTLNDMKLTFQGPTNSQNCRMAIPPGTLPLPIPAGGLSSTIPVSAISASIGGAPAVPVLAAGRGYGNVTLNPFVAAPVPPGTVEGIQLQTDSSLAPGTMVAGVGGQQTLILRIHGTKTVAAAGPSDLEVRLRTALTYDAAGAVTGCTFLVNDCSQFGANWTRSPASGDCQPPPLAAGPCGPLATQAGNQCLPCANIGMVSNGAGGCMPPPAGGCPPGQVIFNGACKSVSPTVSILPSSLGINCVGNASAPPVSLGRHHYCGVGDHNSQVNTNASTAPRASNGLRVAVFPLWPPGAPPSAPDADGKLNWLLIVQCNNMGSPNISWGTASCIDFW